MPLNKNINITLDRIYRQNLLNTNLKKSTLKKHLIDSCTKATFSYDNIFYRQCGGVSMGSSLAPVLVNITLIEFEKVVMTLFMEREILKLYCRYVDYTFVLVKEDQIDKVLKVFNSFHNNLRFTVKDTNNGLFINYNSYKTWHTKTTWITALYDRGS